MTEFKQTSDYAELLKPAKSVVIDPEEDGDDDQSGANGAGGDQKPPLKPPQQKGQVKLMEGERVVFTEEGGPSQYLKLIASGEVDEVLLDALQDFVKRQRKRLGLPAAGTDKPAGSH